MLKLPQCDIIKFCHDVVATCQKNKSNCKVQQAMVLSCARRFQRSKAETVMFVRVFVCCSPSNTLNGYSIANPHDYRSSQSSKS